MGDYMITSADHPLDGYDIMHRSESGRITIMESRSGEIAYIGNEKDTKIPSSPQKEYSTLERKINEGK